LGCYPTIRSSQDKDDDGIRVEKGKTSQQFDHGMIQSHRDQYPVGLCPVDDVFISIYSSASKKMYLFEMGKSFELQPGRPGLSQAAVEKDLR
jgi:hypothetical protein